MTPIGFLGFLIGAAVLILWILEVADLLKRDVPRKEFYKWLGIICILPVVGFLLYYILVIPNIRIRH